MDLKAQCQLFLYEELYRINARVCVVRQKGTHVQYVQKTIPNANLPLLRRIQEHPHANLGKIVEIIELSTDESIIVEEWFNGETLQSMLDAGESFSDQTVIAIAYSLCSALGHLHGQEPSVIHRDVKLSNIMMDSDGVVKLIDYDASRFHMPDGDRDTVLLGTEGYAAPEQFGFQQTDARSDIFSLGVALNFLLTGKHISASVYSEQPLAGIIKKCIMFDPEKRYQSASELRKALATIQHSTDSKGIFPKKQVALYALLAVGALILGIQLWPRLLSSGTQGDVEGQENSTLGWSMQHESEIDIREQDALPEPGDEARGEGGEGDSPAEPWPHMDISREVWIAKMTELLEESGWVYGIHLEESREDYWELILSDHVRVAISTGQTEEDMVNYITLKWNEYRNPHTEEEFIMVMDAFMYSLEPELSDEELAAAFNEWVERCENDPEDNVMCLTYCYRLLIWPPSFMIQAQSIPAGEHSLAEGTR